MNKGRGTQAEQAESEDASAREQIQQEGAGAYSEDNLGRVAALQVLCDQRQESLIEDLGCIVDAPMNLYKSKVRATAMFKRQKCSTASCLAITTTASEWHCACRMQNRIKGLENCQGMMKAKARHHQRP